MSVFSGPFPDQDSPTPRSEPPAFRLSGSSSLKKSEDLSLESTERPFRFPRSFEEIDEFRTPFSTDPTNLPLKGLEVTRIPAAVKAMEKIESAMSDGEMEQSQRENLGMLMTLTMKRLTVLKLGLQTMGSRIRDVDAGLEILQLTRQLMLSQSKVAQLTQAWELRQTPESPV